MWIKTKGKHRRLFTVLAVMAVLVVAVLLFYCRPWSRGTGITVQIARAPEYLDPVRISSYEERLICGAIYETLVGYDAKQHKVLPGLAEKWSSKDGKVFIFTLRQDARFQNGAAVTARDVQYSWERVLDPSVSGYGYLLQEVEGAEARTESDRPVTGLQVLDDRRLKVVLKQTDWSFPAAVSSPALAIVSRQVVRSCGSHYGKPDSRVIGSGPFRLVRWERNRLELRKYGGYPRNSRQIRSLQFIVASNPQQVELLFSSGQADVLAGVPAGLELSERDKLKANIYQKPVLSFYYLGFKLGGSSLAKVWELRKAVDLAIDRKDLTKRMLGEAGKPLVRLIPAELDTEQVNGCNNSSFRDQALQDLAAAGHPYGINLSAVTFVYNDSPGHQFLAELLRAELSRVGIELRLKKYSWAKYLQKIQSDSGKIMRLGWDADYAEPGNILNCNFSAKGINNFTGYSSEKFAKLMQKARQTPDPAARAVYYHQAEGTVLADLPLIPLFQRVDLFILSNDLEGFNVDPLGRIDFNSLEKS